ncbi:hypothetical protein DMENIID0001_099320 [Sergentomyia squamirostris]
MNYLIIFFLLIGAANLSCQSPIFDKDADDLIFEDFDADNDEESANENQPRKIVRRRVREVKTAEISPEASDDFQMVENGFFRPIFRYQKLSLIRQARDTTHQADETIRRNVRSVDSALPTDDDDDLETAEIHIFRPLFRYKQSAAYKRRLEKRKTQQNNN